MLELDCDELLVVEDEVEVLVDEEGEDVVLVVVALVVVDVGVVACVVEVLVEELLVLVGVLVTLLAVLFVVVDVALDVVLVVDDVESAPYAATTASAKITTPTATYFVATPCLSFRVRFMSGLSRRDYR